MSSSSPFSYPFRSPLVADICDHLTSDECQGLRAAEGPYLAFLIGWIPLVSFGGLALGRFLFPHQKQLVLVAAMMVVALLGAALIAWPQRRRVRQFLAGTGYARARGIAPEAIRLYRFF